MCAHKASGDPTVLSAAPVRTEDPALQRTAHVCAHLDTEERPANGVSLFLFLYIETLAQDWEGHRNRVHHNTDLASV